MSRMIWKATHRIVVELKGHHIEQWMVMLHDGKFYTEGIWKEGGEPEWILAQDGNPQYIADGWNPHNKDGRIILQDLQRLPRLDNQ